MFRTHHCLQCGEPFPSGSRKNQQYCSGSCRTLACRQRQRLEIPAAPCRTLPDTSPSGDQPPRPPSTLVQGLLDLEQQHAARNSQLDAARSRTAELEVLVAHYATRESESAAQIRALLKELTAARAHIDALEQRLAEGPCATPQTEGACAVGPALGSKEGSQVGTSATPTVDVSEEVSHPTAPRSKSFERQIQPVDIDSKVAASAQTASSQRHPIDREMSDRIRRAAVGVVEEMGRRIVKRQEQNPFGFTGFDQLHDILIRASEAILIEVVSGQYSALPSGLQLPMAHRRALKVLQQELPDLSEILSYGGGEDYRRLLADVAKMTLDHTGQLLRK